MFLKPTVFDQKSWTKTHQTDSKPAVFSEKLWTKTHPKNSKPTVFGQKSWTKTHQTDSKPAVFGQKYWTKTKWTQIQLFSIKSRGPRPTKRTQNHSVYTSTLPHNNMVCYYGLCAQNVLLHFWYHQIIEIWLGNTYQRVLWLVVIRSNLNARRVHLFELERLMCLCTRWTSRGY